MPGKRDMTGVEPEQEPIVQETLSVRPTGTPFDPQRKDEREPRAKRDFVHEGVKIENLEEWASKQGQRMALVIVRSSTGSPNPTESFSHEWWPECFANTSGRPIIRRRNPVL